MEHQDGTFNSHLEEKTGVEQPSSVNKNAIAKFRARKKNIKSVEEYVEGILAGNRVILSQAITLIESSRPDHQEIAQQIIQKCLPHSGKSIRIGITGVPGVGKSTFIESFGKVVSHNNQQLAVLAVDPSSEKTKGSILGDKTRMEELSVDPKVYIRPSPSAGSLGGVARKTRETIILCEAAGFEVIFIETVGVGQSETAVHSMVDFFLLLMLAGAGDELQGIKRGIMEMADAMIITKADGDNYQNAQNAKVLYQNALHLFPPTQSGWTPQVLTCSSVKKEGLEDIWDTVKAFISQVNKNQHFEQRRSDQARYWMFESINEKLKRNCYDNPRIQDEIRHLEDSVVNGEISSFVAAHQLVESYFKILKD